MKFRKLIIENYKSFQFPTEIHFPDNGDGKSIFLIGGMNGSGKSSLVEAVNICLYGERPETVFNGINTKEREKGNTQVQFELHMEADDGEDLIVQRSWNAGATEQARPKDLEEKLVVVRNGKRVSVQSKQMWQDFINATIPKGITQFFFFDGEKIQEIAADEHSEVRLKSSLEAVLGIQYIAQLVQDIQHIKQEERKNFIEISDEDIELKESELKNFRTKFDKAKALKDDGEIELQKLLSEFDDTKKRFTATFGLEPEDSDETRRKEKKRVQHRTKLSQVEYEIKNLTERYLPFALAGKLFGPIRQQIEKEQSARKGEIILESADTLASKMIFAIDHPQPIFTHGVNDAEKQELKSRFVKVIEEEGKSQIDQILKLGEQDAAKVLVRIEEIENSDLLKLRALIEEKQIIEQDLKELDAGARRGFISESEKQLFDELQATMESLLTQIGRKKEEVRQLTEELIQIENRITEKELELNKLYEKHITSKERLEFLYECDAIIKLLNNYIVQLRQTKIKKLEDKTFDMYKRLATKGDLISRIKVDEKTYEITIEDTDGHVVRKSGLSAGEKEIFAISLLWGLGQASEVQLPIIIDTPLSRLDSVHRDNIINNYFPTAGDQVIILSTDTEVDKNYYEKLQPHLSGAIKLQFDRLRKISSVSEGYFWNN